MTWISSLLRLAIELGKVLPCIYDAWNTDQPLDSVRALHSCVKLVGLARSSPSGSHILPSLPVGNSTTLLVLTAFGLVLDYIESTFLVHRFLLLQTSLSAIKHSDRSHQIP